MARRDDREYREYLREEQRRQPGCPAREMVLDQREQATRPCVTPDRRCRLRRNGAVWRHTTLPDARTSPGPRPVATCSSAGSRRCVSATRSNVSIPAAFMSRGSSCAGDAHTVSKQNDTSLFLVPNR